ncbi:hypothetical protein ABLO27_21515 [Roseibium sp. SCPC15]|uniref:hypothetical protein n=1 Tax=Roseibium sp. SCP15 TaxID=3141376 RepID=UPI00333A210F
MENEKFHIILLREAGVLRSHKIKTGEITKDFVDGLFVKKYEDIKEEIDSEASVNDEEQLPAPYPLNFKEVEKAFSQAMSMYRDAVVATVRMAPPISSLMAAQNIENIASKRGEKVHDLCSEDKEVYSLPMHTIHKVLQHLTHEKAVLEGALYLPKISTIGLISSYDAILSDLLRVIFQEKPEIIFTSDREIKFSELTGFGSIEAAKESITSKEIESIVRQSHHEQFFWMERKFNIKLREGLDIWPNFVELCERRNLLTHTGGLVSEQYLKNCEKYGQATRLRVGEKLDVDLAYFKRAIEIVSEIGYKLIHTMWRKFSPKDRRVADLVLNECGMNLIAAKQYPLAEKILEFGVKQRSHSSDLVKRMMIVNFANALKLGGDFEKCKKVLSANDWSATSYHFQICVAAVKNEIDEVVRLLRLGPQTIEIDPSQFRDWPVFADVRKNDDVKTTFEEIFGEPLIKTEGSNSSAPGIIEDSELIAEKV